MRKIIHLREGAKMGNRLVKIKDFDYFGNSFLLALEHFKFKPTYKLISECPNSYWGGEGSCMCNSHPSATYDVYIPFWLYEWIKHNSWAQETFSPGNEQDNLTRRIINELIPFFKMSEIIDKDVKENKVFEM